MRIVLFGAECEENLALRYIRSSLEHRGHEVIQIPFNHEGATESAARQLAESGACLAGFSLVFTYRAREFAAAARRARELGFHGHLIAGGHFAAFNAEALLRDEPCFDSVGIGEGEGLMLDLAARLERAPQGRRAGAGELGDVCGLVWRDEAGVIHRNAPATKPAELDLLPPPTRLEPPDQYLGLPVANVLGSRGCLHGCAFCSIAAWHKLCGGARLRLRDPALVAEEVAALYARGYRVFNFHDDNFFLPDQRRNRQRFWQLRAGLEARGVGRIAFAVKSRPDTVDQETFAYLKEFGLFRVFLGIEAGTVESLARLGRGQTPDQNDHALAVVNELDLHACFNLLLLNPDSTLEDFQANVGFLRRHCDNPMNFCRTEVYAGTPLERRLRRAGRLLGDYWGYDYKIADPRAQAVFELLYLGLAGRHFGENSIQHLTMRVDFERQLLARFRTCPDRLRRDAKAFVRKVNLNSCDYLDEIAQAAAEGFARPEARQAWLADLQRRVARDNLGFERQGQRLVVSVSEAARPRARSSILWPQEAAAALASSLALLAAPSLAQDGTFYTEMAPEPARPRKPTPKATAAEAARLAESLRPRIVFGLLADQGKPVECLLNLHVDAAGKVSAFSLYALEPGQEPKPLSTLTQTRAALDRVRLEKPAWTDRDWVLRFTLRELLAAQPKTGIAAGDAATSAREQEDRWLHQRLRENRLRNRLGSRLTEALWTDMGRSVSGWVSLGTTDGKKLDQVAVFRLEPGQAPVKSRSLETRRVVESLKLDSEFEKGSHYILQFTVDEVTPPATPPTHMFEVAPWPSGTHMTEVAPRPPRGADPNPGTHMTEMAPIPPK